MEVIYLIQASNSETLLLRATRAVLFKCTLGTQRECMPLLFNAVTIINQRCIMIFPSQSCRNESSLGEENSLFTCLFVPYLNLQYHRIHVWRILSTGQK